MAERRPLILSDGEFKELPVGDTLPFSAGAVSISIGFEEITTIDMAANPDHEIRIDVTDYDEVIIWCDQLDKTGDAAWRTHSTLSEDNGTTFIATGYNFNRLWASGDDGTNNSTKWAVSVAQSVPSNIYHHYQGLNGTGIKTLHGSTSDGLTTVDFYGAMDTSSAPVNMIRLDHDGDLTDYDAGTIHVIGKKSTVTGSLLNKIIHVSDLTTARTVSNADLSGSKFIHMNNAVATTVTINTGLTGEELATFIQEGVGQVTFIAGAGVTIRSADGNLKLRVQYSSATLIPDALISENYFLDGDLIV